MHKNIYVYTTLSEVIYANIPVKNTVYIHEQRE